MKIVVQRSKEASVSVDGKITGAIDHGLVILVGIETADDQSDADWLIGKLINLRIFNDPDGKMNFSIKDVDGQFLVISQFTLHASTKKGNRPSYIRAAHPDHAIPLYDYFVKELENQSGLSVNTGIFGTDMKVALINDGPVTIIIDSRARE